MKQNREPSRASVSQRKIEILNYAGKKVTFSCGHKARQDIEVNFWGKVAALTLPPDKPCPTCRLPSMLKVNACGRCDDPQLDGFGYPHAAACTDPKPKKNRAAEHAHAPQHQILSR